MVLCLPKTLDNFEQILICGIFEEKNYIDHVKSLTKVRSWRTKMWIIVAHDPEGQTLGCGYLDNIIYVYVCIYIILASVIII